MSTSTSVVVPGHQGVSNVSTVMLVYESLNSETTSSAFLAGGNGAAVAGPAT